jgi:hypothetical protein
MNASLKICIQPVLNNSIGSDLVSISTTRIMYAVQVLSNPVSMFCL